MKCYSSVSYQGPSEIMSVLPKQFIESIKQFPNSKINTTCNTFTLTHNYGEEKLIEENKQLKEKYHKAVQVIDSLVLLLEPSEIDESLREEIESIKTPPVEKRKVEVEAEEERPRKKKRVRVEEIV